MIATGILTSLLLLQSDAPAALQRAIEATRSQKSYEAAVKFRYEGRE